MPNSAILICIIFVVGLIMGCLVNLVTDYYVNNKRLCTCEKCDSELLRHGVISIASFLLLKGRCRSCGAKVSRRYPLVELANGALFLIVFMANGWNLLSVCYCLMTSAFLVISIVDFKTYEIPLPCNLFLGVVGIIVCILDFEHLLDHLIGLVAVSSVLYLLYVLSKGAAIGGGDVKLMAAGGLILGWKLGILGFLVGCIVGAVCHVIRMKVSKADRVLAMGPYLSIGLWVCALWGDRFLQWYFGGLL